MLPGIDESPPSSTTRILSAHKIVAGGAKSPPASEPGERVQFPEAIGSGRSIEGARDLVDKQESLAVAKESANATLFLLSPRKAARRVVLTVRRAPRQRLEDSVQLRSAATVSKFCRSLSGFRTEIFRIVFVKKNRNPVEPGVRVARRASATELADVLPPPE